MKVRSKREAEWLAYDEDRTREAERHVQQILAKLKDPIPSDGYASIATLGVGSVSTLDYCLRCGANIIGRERHTAWHASLGQGAPE